MTQHILFTLCAIFLYISPFYAMENEKQIISGTPPETKKYQKLRKIIIINNDFNNNITAKNNNILTTQDTESNVLTKINNGLLTKVKGRISRITFDSISSNILSTYTYTHENTLLELVKYTKQHKTTAQHNPVIDTFSPIILKESLNNIHNMSFMDQGIFSYQKHKEAREAIRQNKALYCSHGQGAIMYNTEKQPDPDTYKEIICNYIDLDQRLKPQLNTQASPWPK